ncbi:MAG: hypothetical protein DI630_13300 [Gordonia sp. (in: high G+C Gram-positive bacteria)]|nr:MAG: hypothetical protein DI630_13300 [Gordonia sp. (in: high G+C Gram-positive bacteria)]
MSKSDAYRKLSARVDKEPLVVVEMRELRDIVGATRLGPAVVESISKDLAGYGIGHIPDPLPPYQDEEVRLFRRGTRLADLIAAVTEPSAGGDELLVAYAANSDSEIVAQLRTLLDGR